ncbi:co-chaperone GroES [candidate division WWE3 bacterium CG08_land_8_20_14_0_20_40_13]|uniref:Co-chaperonin GroES n=1 Tax=candidate division WWE3 bacterium CG08_land_8_20_14_0_20_40_13 TaxID=1975084 RepID=A0A2H0XEC2_UNCKA|nr:MAG: co-chaperone GroES [candidate division WWE3 bacterium CG08_land_8_20_14_0_20_40_13]
MINIKPLLDNIVIEPSEKEKKTASGILIPDSAKEKPQEGKVVAVGPGKFTESGQMIKPAVKVGDTVIYKKWGGNEVKIEGKDYLIVKEEDILATL